MPTRFVLLLSVVAVAALVFSHVTAQEAPSQKPTSGEQQGDPLAEFRHPKNLKVLPKRIKPEDLQRTMRTFSKSLGVRCGFCHEQKQVPAGAHPELDFASDAKEEKDVARKMVKMTAALNKRYLVKIDTSFSVACVTCHRGSPHPMISVDSLPKPEARPAQMPMPPSDSK
jgi:hypothetical protein